MNEAIEACVAFAALILGFALSFLVGQSYRVYVAALFMTLFLFVGSWMVGLLSERRHCRLGEKANIKRAAIYSLIPSLSTGFILFLIAIFISKCIIGEGGGVICGPEMLPLTFAIKSLGLPDSAISLGLIIPWGLIFGYFLTWLAFFLMSRHRAGCIVIQERSPSVVD